MESAKGEILYDSQGRSYLDLFAGNGAVCLGHGVESVRDAVVRQMDQVWISGAVATPVLGRAREALGRWLAAEQEVAGFYSTGMEAAEFAIRCAREFTQRLRLIGFHRAMHGKSGLTAALGWPSGADAGEELFRGPSIGRDFAQPQTGEVQRLPWVDELEESALLDLLEQALAPRDVAAVFLEPLHASGGGHHVSPDFLRAAQEHCRSVGTLLVCDEIFTGFYRAGPKFLHAEAGISPDILLCGKGMGNGFPVSAVVVQAGTDITPAMLPGSTFANHPLAAAAVCATLEELNLPEVPLLVSRIAAQVSGIAEDCRSHGAELRGRGALWVLDIPGPAAAMAAARLCAAEGVAVGAAGRQLRLLPSFRMDPVLLGQALQVVCRSVARAVEDEGS